MVYEFADLRLDTGRRQLSRGDTPIKLTKLSFNVLAALVEAAPSLLTHDELIEKVWGSGRVVSSENLSQRVTMLRQSLGEESKSPAYVETVYGQGFRLIPEVKKVPSSLGTSHDPDKQKRGFRVALGLSLLGLVGWAIYTLYPSITEKSGITRESIANPPVTIAVLPFVNISNDAEQEYFVDGLTEEILNSLVKVEGLLVAGRTSSFAFKNKNVDLREIAEALDVDYLLEGSARKSGDKIRVTAQLIDSASGLHISSSVYDRDISDVFAVQNEISNQVAAELKISLIHKDDQYNAALARLDTIAIEQLLTARAQIAEFAGAPVRQALKTLDGLNSRYPDTPEIMGLTARGYMNYGSTGDVNSLVEMIDYRELAVATLALDATNLDALITLAATADDFAEHRIQAIQYYQKLIRYHPGRAEHYYRMLGYLHYVSTPCEEIKTFVDSVPVGVLSTKVLNAQRDEFEACTIQPWQSSDSDDGFLSLARVVEKNPNQRFLSLLYIDQLKMGAWAAARETGLHIDYAGGHWWASYAAGYSDLYGQPSDLPVDGFIEFLVRANYGAYDRSALFLVHRGSLDEDYSAANRYLDELPEFPIEVATHKSSMALMMLQHRAGQVDASVETAKRLAQAMNQYLVRSPGSYRYYKLAKFHLISAVYANDFNEAQQILNTGFAENHRYWQDDVAAIRTLLSPWMRHPVVAEYVNRIELDRARARDKFGLQ